MTLQFQTVIAGMDKDKLPSKQRELTLVWVGDECVDRGRREDMIRKYPAAVERDIKIYMKLIDIRQLEEHGPVIGNPL